MSSCQYATCRKTAVRTDDGWHFCRGHYLEHRAEFHPAPKPVEVTPAPPRASDADWDRAHQIINDLADTWTVQAITGPNRNRELCTVRHHAMWLIREETALSLPQIGRLFNRDHTTILSALRRATARLAAGEGAAA